MLVASVFYCNAQIPEAIDSLIGNQIDSIFSSEEDTVILTPEEAWVKRLKTRLEAVVNARRVTTVTTRDRRGRRVAKTVPLNYSLGFCVYDLTADSMLYDLNGGKMMIPASTQKLFVSTAALATYGVKHTFDTMATTNGVCMNDSAGCRFLCGDIVLSGGFDPTLTIDDVRAIVDKVKELGVDSISGRILVDNRKKSKLLSHHGWSYDKIPAGEENFITPLLFDEGYTSPYVPRDSVWTTVGKGRNARKVRVLPAYKKQRVKHPEQYFAEAVYKLLKADGVKFATDDVCGVLPDSVSDIGWPVCVLRSPMEKVLPRMMKRSNNYYAESMLLNLCKGKSVEEWTYDECRRIVRDVVTTAGGSEAEYKIIDGSGLSHSNLNSPRMQIKLLRFARLNEGIYSPLYESLPIAGIDGTISDRMKTGKAFNNVRAKTGTVNGVSTLSGYLIAGNGHQLAFSIMVNDLGSLSMGRALQNELCEEMAK